MSVYEAVREYHLVHGDDYGSELSRQRKYRAILSLINPAPYDILLDVGCGERRFRDLVTCGYRGIDVLEGENVMDFDQPHEWVVANGIVYKLKDEREAKRVLGKCWSLCTKGFVFTSLNDWEHFHPDELALDPYSMIRWAHRIANGSVLKMDYKPGDFAILMRR